MTQEEKSILFKDLCARLHYGVKVDLFGQSKELIGILNDIISVGYDINDYEDAPIEDIKPYLRPMSNMTEEEEKDFKQMIGGSNTNWYLLDKNKLVHPKSFYNVILNILTIGKIVDWLNEHHFDYRGLIPMGLAMEAPEDMYKNI